MIAVEIVLVLVLVLVVVVVIVVVVLVVVVVVVSFIFSLQPPRIRLQDLEIRNLHEKSVLGTPGGVWAPESREEK